MLAQNNSEGTINVYLNNPLPLFYQDGDCNEDLYVKAVLTNGNDSPIAGSPVMLIGGELGKYYSSEILMPYHPIVKVQYAAYSDSALTSLVGGSSQEFQLAFETPIHGALPNMYNSILGWFVPLTFNVVQKRTIGFEVVETALIRNFRGVWQPSQGRKLEMAPAGQRAWSWFSCHSDTSLVLIPDDVIYFLGVKYRVMSQSDYSLYGFYQYDLIEDYEG